MYNNEFFQNMDSNVTGNNNYVNQETDIDINMTSSKNPGPVMNNGVQERVINRTFIHKVPQDCFFMTDKNREV